MIFDEPSIFGCYIFVFTVFFVGFVSIFSARKKSQWRLHRLISEKE